MNYSINYVPMLQTAQVRLLFTLSRPVPSPFYRCFDRSLSSKGSCCFCLLLVGFLDARFLIISCCVVLTFAELPCCFRARSQATHSSILKQQTRPPLCAMAEEKKGVDTVEHLFWCVQNMEKNNQPNRDKKVLFTHRCDLSVTYNASEKEMRLLC